MDTSALKTLVGQDYCDFDEEGNYIGCFAPLYHIWADLPRYPLPALESDYFCTALEGLLEGFSEVAFTSVSSFAPVKSEISTSLSSSERVESSPLPPAFTSVKPFDVVVFRLPRGVLHVGVYLGRNEILHVERGSRVEITRLSRLSHRIFAVLRREVKGNTLLNNQLCLKEGSEELP